MYLWNTHKLAKSISQNELSSETKFLYLIYANILYAASGYLVLYFAVGSSGFNYWFELILVLIITIYGTLKCKKVFATAIDKSLIENFFILSLPLSIKMFAFIFMTQTIIPKSIEAIVKYNLLVNSAHIEFIVSLLNAIYVYHSLFIIVIATHWFYWRMSFHLATIVDTKKAT